MAIAASMVCFVACHGGAANHFTVFSDALIKKGYVVEIHATGPALNKFKECKALNLNEFSLEDGRSDEQVASEIAKKCSKAAVVITDVGHNFDITLQKSLKDCAAEVLRVAYYDNPEPYVPGGYSETASQVMEQAHKVLFANATLANDPIYRTPLQEILLDHDRKIPLGYYPLEQAREIAQRRAGQHSQMRRSFFTNYDMVDSGQKIFVYAGGNNTEYFCNAFPAFLRFITELSAKQNLSDVIIILQQHPGAKIENKDLTLVEKWSQEHKDNESLPKILISKMSTDDVLVLADTMLYYQTSMGPQFVLAGIPTIQIGQESYNDILVKNKLCLVVNNAEEFSEALKVSPENISQKPSGVIEKGLGICSNWFERLEAVISPRLGE